MDADRNTVDIGIPGKICRTLKPGDIVGQDYHLLVLIGQGGMGVVYRCWHQKLDREYALKILKPDQINARSWQRFQVEGRAIAMLDHENIVKIFNMGVFEEDCPYYVMELLKGDSLEDLIGSAELQDLNFVLSIFSQLTSAFGYAHNKGIIHRDIKPDNIVLEDTESGAKIVKVVDFGIAKLVQKEALMQQGITAAGEIFGTPLYMSPEQCAGLEMDCRSDIYSLGCTFFKVLTGKFPFLGKSAMETMLMHQNDPVPSFTDALGDREFPEGLEEIISKMLAKVPDNRYQSMAEVRRDLANIAKKNQSATEPDRSGPVKTIKKIPSVSVATTHNTVQTLDLRPKIISFWPIYLVAAILLVGGAYWGVARLLSKDNKGVTISGGRSISHFDPVSPIEENAKSAPVDAVVEKALADFARFGKQSSVLSPDKSTVQMYFPASAVGSLLNKLPAPILAQGTAKLVLARPICLVIDLAENRGTWAEPEILTQIDHSYIDEVWLTRSEMNESPVPHKALKRILEIVTEWKNLSGLCFFAITPDRDMLNLIQSKTHLIHFGVAHSDLPSEVLLEYPSLLDTNDLNLSGMSNLDGVLQAVSKLSRPLSLTLNGASPSAKGLTQLGQSSSLRTLYLQKSSLDDLQLLALSKLSNLKSLSMQRAQFNYDTFVRLPGFKKFKTLAISGHNMEPGKRAAVLKAFPQCKIE